MAKIRGDSHGAIPSTTAHAHWLCGSELSHRESATGHGDCQWMEEVSMKLRYPFCQLHPISLLVATFLAGTIASGLKAQDASIATTRPRVVVDAASQGIVGDGAALNTAAIQSA